MGLKTGLNLIQSGIKAGRKLGTNPMKRIKPDSVAHAENLTMAEPFCTKIPELIKPLTAKQIAEIKPSEFKTLLESRVDIAESFRVPVGTNKRPLIYTPEQLSLYDEINNALLLNNISPNARTAFLTSMMHLCPENAEYAKKIMPTLIQKGYDLNLLSRINITENNYKFIETVINKQAVWEAKCSAVIEAQINAKITERMKWNEESALQRITQKTIQEFQSKKEDYINHLIKDICSEIDGNNIKYLDEWCTYTDKLPINPNITGIGSIETGLLSYWDKDTLKILEDFVDTNMTHKYELLEVIKRRGHNYKSIKEIFGNTKMTDESRWILEFKNFNKFKNINLETFNTLTSEEKKEFINAFISIRTNNSKAMALLKDNLKMYEYIDLSSRELTDKTYSETLKKLIESLPVEERKSITQMADWGKYSKKYREANPIPALVDDLEKLPVKYETVNGRKFPVSEITNNTDLAISSHVTSGNSFLNVQALEFTDPNEILCVGTKGLGKYVHYDKSGYAIAVKPRQGRDFWMQFYCDFDSGTNSTKNVMNVSKRFDGRNDFYAYVPELIKKELNLSQKEYTKRMQKLNKCTTLDEIGKIDNEMEITIRKVLKENPMYEGILRPEPMGVLIPYEMPLSSVNPYVLDYVEQHAIKFIRVKNVTAESDAARRSAAANFIQNSVKITT